MILKFVIAAPTSANSPPCSAPSVADDQHRRLLHVVHHRFESLLVGLRIGHSLAGLGDGFEKAEQIAALHRVVYMTEGHTLNNQILRDIFHGFGSFSL